jgi:hypothetical protein
LTTAEDFERIKNHVAKSDEPWNTTWTLLTASPYAQSSYQPIKAVTDNEKVRKDRRDRKAGILRDVKDLSQSTS